MPTISSIKFSSSSDGHERLAKVNFTPQVPNPAKQFDVEVVFLIERVAGGSLDYDPYAIALLSSTRMDTREPYHMSREQLATVRRAAVAQAADEDEIE